MKPSSIAACLVFAAAATLVTQPWAERRESPVAFEVTVESSQPGLVQLYYDLGGGMMEVNSVVQPVQSGRPMLLRFPLPYGRIHMLRFDPLDRDGRLTLGGARIADRWGHTLIAFAPGEFLPSRQIDSAVEKGGKLEVVTTPGGNDPQMILLLSDPLVIERPPVWLEVATLFAASVVALMVLAWAWRSSVLGLPGKARRLWEAAAARPAWAVVAAALAATVVANAPVIFAGRSLVSPNMEVALLYGQNPWLPGTETADIGNAHKTDVAALLWHHLPLSTIQHQAVLEEGELPLWNRFDSAGCPLLGQGQSCFGDPLQLLPILAGGAGWAWELKFLLAKWAFACGIGLCVLLGFRSLPAALGLGASAAFIGFFVYRINHPAVFSLCYAPWILYCWLRVCGTTSARAAILWLVALIGANWTEMTSGTAKEAYLLLLSMNFAGACLLLSAPVGPRRKLALLAGAVAAGGVFGMVGAPIWLTFFRALKVSYTSYNSPAAFQLQPGMLIGLFNEAFYRPFQDQLGVINPSANILVLVGLLWAVVRWRSVVADRFALGLIVASVPLLALVFGVVPPGLIVRIPVLGNIQHVDNTLSCALIVVFMVLSGVGWREAWQRLGSADGGREARVVVALLVAVFAAYLGTAQAVVRSGYWTNSWGKLIQVPAFIHGYGWSLVAASALLLGVLHRGRLRHALTPATLVLAAVALGALHWREALHLSSAYSDYTVRPTHRVDLKADSPTIEALQAQRDNPFRVVGFHNDLLPGWSIMYGLEGISGPDALVNPYYRDFMDTAGITRIWDWRYIVEPADVEAFKPVLDAINVRFYVGYRLAQKPDPRVLAPYASSDMDTFESTTAWPRAFFTDSVAVYKDLPQFCSWVKAGDGRPFAAIQDTDWVRLSPMPRVSGDLSRRQVRPASAYRLGSNTTSFTVNATGPGFIVLTEAYEKDNFRATLNGERVPYIRANHAFKAIYVEQPGTYEVSFTYFPRGFWMALKLFLAGLAVILAAVALAVFVLKPAAAQARA